MGKIGPFFPMPNGVTSAGGGMARLVCIRKPLAPRRSGRSLGRNYSRHSMFNLVDMKTILMPVLLSAALLASGCACSHPRPTSWEYKTDTTWPEAVPGKIAKFEREGWSFVSMAAAAKTNEGVTVILLFKRHR